MQEGKKKKKKTSKNSRFFYFPGMVLKCFQRKKEVWSRCSLRILTCSGIHMSSPWTSGGVVASFFSSREVRDRMGID